jgi:hypothetical protein
MSAMNPVQQLNRDLADKLVEEAKQNPRSPYAGKKAGIANGQVVVVADTWREVARQLRQAEPDPAKTLCIELGRDQSEVCYFPFALEERERPAWVKDALAAAHAKRKVNEEVADNLIEEAKRDPASWPLDKFVGIANGRVVTVSNDLHEIARQLEQAESDAAKTFIVEPGRDYSKVYEIWEVSCPLAST